jgi:hypothetical protein
MRAINHVFLDVLEGAAPPNALLTQLIATFRKIMLGYLRIVIKHTTTAIAMTNFQRDPSFSARVSLGSYAWRVLIDLFDYRGVVKTLGLLAKFLDSQSETESIDAFLQRIQHTYQDINEDLFMVNEKILVAAISYNLKTKS